MTHPLIGNSSRGSIFILSAPAGTGKTTLVKMLTNEFPQVVASVSYTTRSPREGEQDGIHYHFVSEDEFERRTGEGEFLEQVKLYGNYYGTSREWVERHLAKGKHVVLVIDTQGALLLKDKIDAIYIFVQPPSLEELKRRLLERRTEPEEVIAMRLEWAKQEMEIAAQYDYKIINDNLGNAYQVLRSIVIAEEHRIR